MRNCSSVPNNSLFDRKDNQNSYAATSFHDIFYRRRQFSPIPRHKERTTNDINDFKVVKDFKDLKDPLPRKTIPPRDEIRCGAEYLKYRRD